MLVLQQNSGVAIALMQRTWVLFRHRHVKNIIGDSTLPIRLYKNGINRRFCSACSLFDNVSNKNIKLNQRLIEKQLSSSVRHHSFQIQQQKPQQQHRFQPPQQVRYYNSTRPNYKTRHSKNMIDRLYDEKMLKTNHEDEIPTVVGYARMETIKPPLKWIRENWKQQFCEMVPKKQKASSSSSSSSSSSPPTKIVQEYHYNDTPTRSDGDDDTDPFKTTTTTTNRTMKGLSVTEKKENKKTNVMRTDNDDKYSNVTTQVHQSSGKKYSKTTTSVRRTSKGGSTYSSVTTISSSNNCDPDHDSDNENEIDFRKFFSDDSDDENDDNFFADSDNDDEDDADDDKTIIDMPATASKNTQQRLPPKTFPPFPKASPPSSNSQPAVESPSSKESHKSSSASSSWSISLNDADFDLDHTDYISSAASQADAKGIPENPTATEEGDICYKWDHDAQKMKPIRIIGLKDADMSNIETNKRANTFDTELVETGLDTASSRTPEKPYGFAHNGNMKSDFIAADTEKDEYSEDMVDINNYLQITKPRLVPRNLDNWWDRDDDLVSKAKRKTKLATIRKAQDEPLNKKCKTCPVCKRVFKGHAAFIDHAINKGNCSKDIDDSIKEQLKAQKIDMKTKKKEKNKRKRNFTGDDLF